MVDVLGAREPQIDQLLWLAGNLPYKVPAAARRFSEVPDNLRIKFRYQIYRAACSRLLDGSPLLNFQQPTVALADKTHHRLGCSQPGQPAGAGHENPDRGACISHIS